MHSFVENKGLHNKDRPLLLIIVFAFAPYVLPNVPLPLGPLFVYLMFFYLFLINRCVIFKVNKELTDFFWLFTVIFIAGILSTILNLGFDLDDNLSMIKKISQFESSLRPMCLLGMWGYIVRGRNYEDIKNIFLRICYFFMIILSINAIFSVLTIFMPKIPALLKIFHTYDFTQQSVAEASATMGRYTGIFGQPVNAGFAYSLGLLLWIYVIKNKLPDLLDYLILGFLFIGGLFVLSKISLFVGPVLFVVYGFLRKNVFFAKSGLFFGFMVIFITVTVVLFPIWHGRDFFDYFMGLFSKSNLFSAFTSGRYGIESNGYIDYMLSKYNLIIGSGYGISLFDSGYLYYFLVSGIFGFFAFVVLNLKMIFLAIGNKFEENKLLFFITILFAISNLGAPIGVEPMISTVFWMVIFLLVNIIALAPVVNKSYQ